jgi:penicillin-binding protein 1A
MASAFTVFPNLGIQAKPYFIRRVEDYDHALKEENGSQSHPVLEPRIAEQMLRLLQEVVQSGTATSAKSLKWPVGGKTGTTDDFTDAWFVGFSPSITAAVWIGFDEKKTLGARESGAVAALPIWIDCMREILKDKPMETFAAAEPAGPVIDDSSDSPGSKSLYIEDLPVTKP